MADYRLWTIEEMEASDEIFVPRNLANLLLPLLLGEYLDEPFGVGI